MKRIIYAGAFNSDGNKLYLTNSDFKIIYEYKLSTPFEIHTSKYSRKLKRKGIDRLRLKWSMIKIPSMKEIFENSQNRTKKGRIKQ